GKLSQAPRHFVAVHAGQADVEQDHFRYELRGYFQRARSVVSGAYLVPHELEHLSQAFGRVDVVVHHKHPTRRDFFYRSYFPWRHRFWFEYLRGEQRKANHK